MTLASSPCRIRRAARVLVLDASDRLLLFRFVASDRDPFWATAGGECDPGESFEQAARRELLEETGIEADPGHPIASRGNDFVTFDGEEVTADERYFRVTVSSTLIDRSQWTALEREVMGEHRWFTRSELLDWHETIFPDSIVELLDLEKPK